MRRREQVQTVEDEPAVIARSQALLSEVADMTERLRRYTDYLVLHMLQEGDPSAAATN